MEHKEWRLLETPHTTFDYALETIIDQERDIKVGLGIIIVTTLLKVVPYIEFSMAGRRVTLFESFILLSYFPLGLDEHQFNRLTAQKKRAIALYEHYKETIVSLLTKESEIKNGTSSF